MFFKERETFGVAEGLFVWGFTLLFSTHLDG